MTGWWPSPSRDQCLESFVAGSNAWEGGLVSQQAVGYGLAEGGGEACREFLRAFVVAEMVFAEVLRERGVNVRTIAAVQDLELFKVVQDGDGRGTAPAVANGLEIIVRRGDVAVGFLGFDVEFHVAKIGREVKGVVGPPLGAPVPLPVRGGEGEPRSTLTSCSKGFFCVSWFTSQPRASQNLSMKSRRASCS